MLIVFMGGYTGLYLQRKNKRKGNLGILGLEITGEVYLQFRQALVKAWFELAPP
jgi:phage regulator Rha-like protein